MLDRRTFLKSLGGGLVVISARIASEAQETGGREAHWGGEPLPKAVAAWLHIGPDNVVTAFTGKVEVGQNARTSLTQALADELRREPVLDHLVMGVTDRCPFDMGTCGSRTMPTMAPILRRM